jgi:anti-sigma regulatory factor (Ser/Thr protein kinase)
LIKSSYAIKEQLDIYEPRRAVQALGARLGLSRSSCQELAIVVSELASNIVKYGKSGSVEMEEIVDQEFGRGILIVARDVGPPFRNLAMALQDGFDDEGPIDPGKLLKRGGIGAGLGAIVRLTDSFRVEATEQGKLIRVERFVKRPRRRRSRPPG